MSEEFIWTEKYRPDTIADMILPKDLKATFYQFVEQKDFQHLLLAGSAGIGKTTVAKAMLNSIGADHILINASLQNGIDVLRNQIADYASTMSFYGGRKFVILDEADNLTNVMQMALRSFMEEYSKNCGFILTANAKNKIILPLQSRCAVIDLTIPKDEKKTLIMEFHRRASDILKIEGVKCDKLVLAQLITKHYPDWRKCLNILQEYSTATKSIDTGVLADKLDSSVDALVQIMKDKDFTKLRKWVGENSDISQTELYRSLYDQVATLTASPDDAFMLVVTIGEWSYKGAFIDDPEIAMTTCLAHIMGSVELKK